MSTKSPATRADAPSWVGPLGVTAQVNLVAPKSVLPEAMRMHGTFHIYCCSRRITGVKGMPPPPMTLVDGKEEVEVQAILDHSYRSTGRARKGAYTTWLNRRATGLNITTGSPRLF